MVDLQGLLFVLTGLPNLTWSRSARLGLRFRSFVAVVTFFGLAWFTLGRVPFA